MNHFSNLCTHCGIICNYGVSMVKTSVSYHETSHLQPTSVRIVFRPMWLCDEVHQFTCGRSVVSSQIHCIMYNVSGFSLPPIKTDRHHITEEFLSMAKNDKQTMNIDVLYLFHNTGKSRYLEIGYVEYTGCVELSGRFRPYLEILLFKCLWYLEIKTNVSACQ
jgi:hypothetical protein